LSNEQHPDTPAAARLACFGSPAQLKAAAAQLNVNSVRIDPGGATFPTIGAALASITDNSRQKQYLVSVGPGTYNEQVVLKPYVYVQGAGQDQTTVTQPPTPQGNIQNRGTVIASANSNISDMTISCTGGSWGEWSTALLVPASGPFYADNVALVCDDEGDAGINMETVAVNWNTAGGGASQLYLSYSTVTARGQSHETTAVALTVGTQGAVEAIESKVVAQGAGQSFGVSTALYGTVTLDDCYIEGGSFALYNSDGTGPITANNCQIDGPVSGGVVVNNNDNS